MKIVQNLLAAVWFKRIKPLLYQAFVNSSNTFRVHLLHLTVVGEESVDLDFHVGGLGVDCRGQAFGDERAQFVFQ